MRKFIFALILFIGVIFILGKTAEVQDLVATLQRGDWRYLALAFLVEAVWIVNMAASYRSIYQALGLEEKVNTILPVAAAANFLNIITPTAGVSGVAMFIAEARKRNYSPARAAVGGVLYVLFDYAAFLCVLVIGLVILYQRHTLNIGEVFASILLVIIALILAVLIYLGRRSARSLGMALDWMARIVNRLLWPFLHRDYLSEERAYEFAADAAEGLRELDGDYQRLLQPFVLALAKQVLLILILFLCFEAFGVPISLGTLVAGFSIGYLFMIVSPTPNGLGVVEGILPLVLSTMSIPLGAAAIVTVAYRGITFWTPLVFGMFSFRLLGGTKGTVIEENS